MATKINNSADTATDRDKPVTFEEAEDLGTFELASQWADRLPWPLPQNRSASDDLAELAFAAASTTRSGSGIPGRYSSENLSSAVSRRHSRGVRDGSARLRPHCDSGSIQS